LIGSCNDVDTKPVSITEDYNVSMQLDVRRLDTIDYIIPEWNHARIGKKLKESRIELTYLSMSLGLNRFLTTYHF